MEGKVVRDDNFRKTGMNFSLLFSLEGIKEEELRV